MIGKSMEQMIWLLSLSSNYSLTVWSAFFDKPNIKDLVVLQNKVSNSKKIFYDLPSDQKAKFMEELKVKKTL